MSEEEVVRQIRRDEVLAEMASERCSHFVKGGCAACETEKAGRSMAQRLQEVETLMDEEYEANGESSRWHDLQEEALILQLDMGELSHP